jgi:hypothetical protein
MSDMRSLLVTLAGLFAVFAAGCNWMLEPIEQRFLFRPWPSDPALLGSVASRDNGIEEIRVKTPDGVTLHGVAEASDKDAFRRALSAGDRLRRRAP